MGKGLQRFQESADDLVEQVGRSFDAETEYLLEVEILVGCVRRDPQCRPWNAVLVGHLRDGGGLQVETRAIRKIGHATVSNGARCCELTSPCDHAQADESRGVQNLFGRA